MNLRGENCKTEDEFLLKLIEKSVWHVQYHERELNAAHRRLAIVKAALARGYAADDFAGVTHDSEVEMEDAESPIAFVRAMLGQALSSIKHHEDELRNGHADLAMVKAALARARFTFDMVKITAEQIARLDGK
jgi:hypothetical protein